MARLAFYVSVWSELSRGVPARAQPARLGLAANFWLAVVAFSAAVVAVVLFVAMSVVSGSAVESWCANRRRLVRAAQYFGTEVPGAPDGPMDLRSLSKTVVAKLSQ